ncbi:hypothetical protein R1T40_13940 [Tritonibacter scottomollicae]|uniref:Uncharacterized protein n=1 Tax=Tritonibacter scottomollicae TaxID=483013 RepID=A0ABZ0HEQ2_TRISK|nr:hypothetical protein [Tritonibacter scottomollicae]WOI32057.1 hypothetical protein R1T40_13940 [Tritonibacter scottomollicae]
MSQRFRTSFQTLDFRCQPNRDIRTRRGEVSAASEKSSPKAAVQQPVADLVDAASGTSDREAQLVTFAKSMQQGHLDGVNGPHRPFNPWLIAAPQLH